jgi:AcrR family transcriptional regulator
VSAGSSRDKLLAAAARVLSECGFAGTTTRRVAEEAGLNEVTLFRHFGTKEHLLEEAVRTHGARPQRVGLPPEPAELEAELTAWCQAHLERLRSGRGLLRRCLGDQEQLPLVDAPIETGGDQAAIELRAYVAALRRTGLVSGDPMLEEGAISLLVSALLVDGLARDDFPHVVADRAAEAASIYARTFLAVLAPRAADRRVTPVTGGVVAPG